MTTKLIGKCDKLFLTYADLCLLVGKALRKVKNRITRSELLNLPSGGPLAAAAPR